MASSHLPQWRKFEGYLFKDIIEIYKLGNQYVGQYPRPNVKTGMYEPMDTSYDNVTDDIKLHCYQQKTSMSALYQTAGTQFEDTITVVIRHNPTLNRVFYNGDFDTDDVDELLLAKFHGRHYRILNISADDSHYGSYDYLTLKAFEGVKSDG